MAIRIVIVGRRTAAMSHGEYVEYLEREHAPLVEELPGLMKLTTATPLDPEESGYDALSELWFETPADLEAAMESETWQRVLTDAERFADLEETVVVTVGEQTLQYQSVQGGV